MDPPHTMGDRMDVDLVRFVLQGAWGASALLSKKWKHLCSGVERYGQFCSKMRLLWRYLVLWFCCNKRLQAVLRRIAVG